MVFERFYSYPPVECQWPWVLRNIKQKPQPEAVHEIVDVGILDLLEPPYQHSEEKIKMWRQVETDGWKVVFDCFDLKGEFGIRGHGFDTVEYSKELLTEFYNGESNLLPVIQGRSRDYQSFKEYTDYMKKQYPEVNVIGVSGSVGRCKDRVFVQRVCRYIRRVYPLAWVHVFALHKNNFRLVHDVIDSFDSMNWTRPRTRGRGSCKNKAERIRFFWDYIDTLELPHHHKEQGVLECF